MHEMLLKNAKEAIDRLFGDRSVSVAKTIESMEELRDEIDIKIDALQMDLAVDDKET